MSPTKKLFHVSMVVDHSTLYDVMESADGKAYDLKVVTVKSVAPPVLELSEPDDEPQPKKKRKRGSGTWSRHKTPRGRYSQATQGEPPIGREWIIEYAKRHHSFDIADLLVAGAAVGLQKGNLYTSTSKLMKQKVLKRGEPGVYHYQAAALKKIEAKAAKKTARKAKPAKANGHANGANGHSISELLAAELRKSTEPTPLINLKRALEPLGIGPGSVGPTLHDMMNRKQVIRPDKGMYQLAAAAQ